MNRMIRKLLLTIAERALKRNKSSAMSPLEMGAIFSFRKRMALN